MSDAATAARVFDALAELRELHSSDPAAAAAMRAIKLTRWTLERIHSSAEPEDPPTVS